MIRSIVNFIGVVLFTLAFFALLGWVASMCVQVIFGINFDFMQGIALVLLTGIIALSAKMAGGDQS